MSRTESDGRPIRRPSTHHMASEGNRPRLLAAAREMLCTQPYFEITDRQACERAGVSAAELRDHYGSAAGLAAAVFDEMWRGLMLKINDAIAASHDPTEQVRAAAAVFLEGCADPLFRAAVLRDRTSHVRHHTSPSAPGCLENLVNAVVRPSIGLSRDSPSRTLAAAVRGALAELSMEIATAAEVDVACANALLTVDRLFCKPASPSSRWPRTPRGSIRIGVGQLRANAGGYLQRAAAGETFEILYRGLFIAQLVPAQKEPGEAPHPRVSRQ